MNSLKPGVLKRAHEKTVFAPLHLAWDIQHINRFPYGLKIKIWKFSCDLVKSNSDPFEIYSFFKSQDNISHKSLAIMHIGEYQ